MRVTVLFILVVVVFLTGVSGCATWNAEKTAPMLGEHINVDGVDMHVLDMGPRNAPAPPVILIHGASVNLRDMKLALGDALAQERRVIIVDRPGRGYSERPDEGWRLKEQAAHINAATRSLGVENPVVVGQSFGGAVALAYALQYQNEMSGLVLLAPVSHEWPGGVSWYNSVSETPVIGFLLRRFVIPIYGQLAAKDGVEDSFEPDTPPENYAERSGLALLFRPKDFRSNASDLVNLKKQIIEQQTRYGELALPVAILTGVSDTTVSPELHSKALARDIDDATLTLLPDTGHALHHAETEKVLAAIAAISKRADK